MTDRVEATFKIDEIENLDGYPLNQIDTRLQDILLENSIPVDGFRLRKNQKYEVRIQVIALPEDKS